MKWICVKLLLVLALLTVVSGCATTESENASERPWNAPNNWEHGMPSSLYDRQR